MTIWCRVCDLTTRHVYDVPIGRLDQLVSVDAVEEIPGQRVRQAHPRKPEHHRPPATVLSAPTDATPPVDTEMESDE